MVRATGLRVTGIPIALVLAGPLVGLAVLGPVAMVVFIVAFGGGFALWIATTYRSPVDPSDVMAFYLAAIVLFVVHVDEEYATDFEVLLSNLSGGTVSEQSFLTVAAFAGPALWLGGATLLSIRRPLGYYLLSVFIVAMTIAELSHFAFPFLEDGTFHYTPGMYTAALPLIPTWLALRVVLRERRLRSRRPGDQNVRADNHSDGP